MKPLITSVKVVCTCHNIEAARFRAAIPDCEGKIGKLFRCVGKYPKCSKCIPLLKAMIQEQETPHD